MGPRILTALPVYNEERHLRPVLGEVCRYAEQVLVVDDGSTDGTPQVLAEWPGIDVLRHEENRGYGAALVSAFRHALHHNFDVLVTIDCDGQHEPQLIPALAQALLESHPPADMISGSRYLKPFPQDTPPPADRRRINQIITCQLNELFADSFGAELTDAFCGFKAYRVSSLADLEITEFGYAMPLQLWIQAAALGWTVQEFPVPLVYLEEERSFGGSLDDSRRRLEYYREVLKRELGSRFEDAVVREWELSPCGS